MRQPSAGREIVTGAGAVAGTLGRVVAPHALHGIQLPVVARDVVEPTRHSGWTGEAGTRTGTSARGSATRRSQSGRYGELDAAPRRRREPRPASCAALFPRKP